MEKTCHCQGRCSRRSCSTPGTDRTSDTDQRWSIVQQFATANELARWKCRSAQRQNPSQRRGTTWTGLRAEGLLTISYNTLGQLRKREHGSRPATRENDVQQLVQADGQALYRVHGPVLLSSGTGIGVRSQLLKDLFLDILQTKPRQSQVGLS